MGERDYRKVWERGDGEMAEGRGREVVWGGGHVPFLTASHESTGRSLQHLLEFVGQSQRSCPHQTSALTTNPEANKTCLYETLMTDTLGRYRGCHLFRGRETFKPRFGTLECLLYAEVSCTQSVLYQRLHYCIRTCGRPLVLGAECRQVQILPEAAHSSLKK